MDMSKPGTGRNQSINNLMDNEISSHNDSNSHDFDISLHSKHEEYIDEDFYK